MPDIMINTKSVETFSAFDKLRLAETRLESVTRYAPTSSEVQRFQSIIADLQSSMSKDSLIEYAVQKNAVATAEELKKQRAADIKRMNENRDSQSI
jgi:ribosomal protein L12E/L44/L45/RPP1/RPP2